MSKLHKGVDEYLAMRRSLGSGLRAYDTVLHDCATFIDRHSHGVLTTAVLLRWATHRGDVSQAWWFHQLGVARGFARFWSAKDSRTEVPPLGLLPKKKKRRQPYLYTDDDVARLIRASSAIRCRAPLWPVTMATLIGLLAVTGMRIGEVLALDDRDLDRETKVLTVRRAKFGKARLIPLHSTTCSALLEYVRQRDRWHHSFSQSPFFPSPTGKRLQYGQVHRTFGVLLEQAGLPRSHRKSGPGLHDLRHRFAINTLLHWYRAGLDVERRIYSLSTYLGHGRVDYTYWYLSAAPELMGLARRRLERSLGELP
jgi:integrase